MKKLLLFIFITNSLTVFSKNWYLNDGSRVGDVYCTAVGGANGGTGLTPNSPKLFATGTTTTLKTLIASAAFSPGDVIFIDAMDFSIGSLGSDIAFNKALTLIGAGPNKTILKGPGGASTVKFGVISSSNIIFKNFKCSGWSGASSGSASCLDIIANSSDISGIILDGFWFDQNLGSGGDGACKIYGSYKISATIKNMLTTCNDNASYGGGFWIEGNGHIITFSNCYFFNNKRNTNGGAINIFGTNSSDGITTLVNIDKCSFSNNGSINNVTSANGGAISITGAKLIVTNCCFSNNIIGNTGQYGNAICGLKNSRISISNSTFSSNTGAKGQVSSYNFNDPSIIAGSYELIIDNCSFDNSASSSAKCIYYKPNSGTFSVNNCTFTSSGYSTQIYSGVAWSLTNSAITSGTNPVLEGVAPSTINTLLPTSTPVPICNGAISGDCSATIRTIDCTSDNLPPIIKGHDSTYVTNTMCTFKVPTYIAIDLCDPSPTVTSVPAAGTALASGTTTPVVITATDATGNSTSITVYLTTPACSSCFTLTSAIGTDNQSLCSNTSLTNITYSTKPDITGISNSGVSGANGLPPGVSVTYNAGVVTVSGIPTNDASYNYSIPLVGGTCDGQTVTGTISVNPFDNASFTYPNNSFCSTKDPNPTPTITGTIGGAFSSSQTGLSINPSTGSINLNSSSAGTYEVKYTTNGQCPNVSTFPISIGSNPSVNAISNQTICQGANFNSINFTGTPGTVFQWTNSNPAIGLAASGTGNIASFIGLGATSSSPNVSSTITVTPKIGSCIGAAKSFTLTVKYKDEVAISYSDASYCSSNSNPTPTITGVQGGVFSSIPIGLVLNSSTGLVDINTSSEGVYEVKYQTSSGCGASTTTSLGISNNPLVNNIPDQSICSGISFTDIIFTGTPGTEYQWTNSNTAIGLAESGKGNISSFVGSNNGSSPITSVITVTPKSGACIGSSKTFLLTVNPLDNASFTYSSSSFCLTESNPTPTITGTTGGTFSSSPTGLSINTSGSINLVSSSAGTYEVKYTTNGQCPNVSSFPISIGSNPAVNPVSDQSVCQGSNFNSINFTGTPGTVFQWTNSNPAIGLATSGTGNIPSFVALGSTIGGTNVNATITVTPKVGSCIGASKSFKLNVNSQNVTPSVSVAASSSTICSGTSVTFTATPTDGGAAPTYQWKLNGADVGTGGTTYTNASLSNGDVVTVVMTGNNTCQTTATTNGNSVTMVVTSTVTPSFTAISAICSGASLSALPTTSNNGITGTWSPALDNTATTTYTFTPTAGQCATTTTLTITVNPNITPSFTAVSAICSGANLSALPTTSNNGITGTWSPVINNTATTTYTFTPDADQCASSTTTMTVKVNLKPTITGATSLCVGSTTTFTGTGMPHPVTPWNSSEIKNATVDKLGVITGINSGSSIIKFMNEEGCTNSLNIDVNPIPTVDTIPDYTICAGYFADSIKFKGSAGASFDWTNSNPNTGLMSNGVNIIRSFNAINNSTTNQISVVSVTPKSGKCLGATKKFNIIVRSTPQLVVTQVDTIVCPGGNINFKTDITPAVTSPIYQWTVNGTKVGVNSPIYWSNTLKNKDKISVNVTGKDFCPSSANLFVRMDSLRLSIQAPSMIYLKDPAINLVGFPVGGTFSGKGVANNKLDPSVVGVGNKMITYSFKNANNCSGQLTQKVVVYDTVPNNCHSITYDTITDTVTVLKFKFKLTTGIKANQETSIRVFPNPTSDILVVEAADEKALAGYRYKLMDAAGKEVYNQPVKSTITEISLKSLGAAGIYFFEVFDEKQQRLVTKKIILD